MILFAKQNAELKNNGSALFFFVRTVCDKETVLVTFAKHKSHSAKQITFFVDEHISRILNNKVFHARAAGAFTFAHSSAKVNKTPFVWERYLSHGPPSLARREIGNDRSALNVHSASPVQNSCSA